MIDRTLIGLREEEMRMGRYKRAVLAVVATAAVAVAFAATASGAGKTQIAVFYYNPSPYGVASWKAAQVEAAKLGVQVTGYDGNNVPETQTTQMEDAITSGKFKAFWVWALDGVSLAPTIKQAEAKGIKVAVADYTLGSLQAQVTLTPTSGLVSTIGGSIGKQEKAFVTLIKLACRKQVGSGPCNVAFMPGLADYPTDTLRERYMEAQFAHGNIHFKLTPPGMYDQPTAQQVTLTYFQSKPSVQVFASFGDQMSAGAVTAFKQLGIVAGKNIQVIGSGATNQIVAGIKSGIYFGSVALYPCTESYVGIKDLVAALGGKTIPSTVDVIDTNHPLVIDAATLKSTPGFTPDWSLTGAPG
jgi:ribose transport system substrate-binding protein